MPPVPVKRLLQGAKVPAFLVTDPTNVYYLSGLDMSFGYILVIPKGCVLFTDARYLEQARGRSPKSFSVCDVAAMEEAMRHVRACGYDEEAVTVGKLRRMKRKFKNTRFIQTSGVLAGFRRRKSPEEIRCFLRAKRITRELIARIPGVLRRGISERDLAWKLETWARELGADGLAFPPIVAFGTHTSSPHHHPTARRLLPGHIVQIDVGARYRGYCADQSAVFFTKHPTPLQRRVYDAVARAKEAALRAVRPGVSTHKIDTIARAVLREEGLEEYFVHSLGHGVGLEIHEGPSLSNAAPDTALLRNEIITIEPGVYFPGRFGIRLEEEVVVQ